MRKRKDIPIDLLYLPALVLLAAFVLYPLISGIQISFTNWNGYSPRFKYVGLANYKKMFHDKMFYTALKNTLIYGIGSTTLQTVIGISYALLLQKKFHGQTLARVVIYLPAMIASLIMGYISYFLVQYNNGAINDVVSHLRRRAGGLDGGRQAGCLDHRPHQLPAIRGQNHDRDDRRTPGDPGVLRRGRGHRRGGLRAEAEAHHPAPAAARHHHQRDFKPVGGLKLFGIILSTTSGGPGYSSHSLSTLINYLYFQNQNAGYSAAVGMFMFLFIMVISTFVRNFFERKVAGLS